MLIKYMSVDLKTIFYLKDFFLILMRFSILYNFYILLL